MSLSMTVLPFLYNYEISPPRRNNHHLLADQDFGVVLTPEDLLTPSTTFSSSEHYFRPWTQLGKPPKNMGSCIKREKDKYRICLHLQHFTLEEISVKTANGYVVVEAKHKEKEDDHGYVSRQFVRRYALPENAAPESVEARLMPEEGVLIITMPKKKVDTAKDERIVPITQIDPAQKQSKGQNDDKEDKKKKKSPH